MCQCQSHHINQVHITRISLQNIIVEGGGEKNEEEEENRSLQHFFSHQCHFDIKPRRKDTAANASFHRQCKLLRRGRLRLG